MLVSLSGTFQTHSPVKDYQYVHGLAYTSHLNNEDIVGQDDDDIIGYVGEIEIENEKRGMDTEKTGDGQNVVDLTRVFSMRPTRSRLDFNV